MEFSFARVLSLLKRECILNGKVFLLLAIALCAVCAFIMFITTEEYCSQGSLINIVNIIYTSIILLGGTIFSISIFTEFREPNKRASYLGLPSSPFEKWLSKWILAVPVYLIFSFLIIYLTYKPVAYAIESVWSECRFIPILETFDIRFKFTLMSAILYQSFAFILGILFNKYAVLKSIATGVLLTLIFFLFTWIRVNFTPYSGTPINFNEAINHLILIALFLWLISYFILKRKQI